MGQSARVLGVIVFSIFLTTCGYDPEPPAGDGVGKTGSWWEPFDGPGFPSLICCPTDSECSDGDDVYTGCYMPDTPNENGSLCLGEFPFVCDYCPDATEEECDGTGWVDLGANQFQCDGPVYRGVAVRRSAADRWYIPGASSSITADDFVFDAGSPSNVELTLGCNDSYELLCESAACFEQDCIPCAGIVTSSGNPLCEPGADCHPGKLENSSALLCCSELNHNCIRPNATTQDCTGSTTYDLSFTTLASCAACPNPDPNTEEFCHGWDLGNDPGPLSLDEELGSSMLCLDEDEIGCKPAVYACDGTLTTTTGVELKDSCTSSNNCFPP